MVRHEYAQHVGRITLHDWNPLQPSFNLQTSMIGEGPLEFYDHPGGYTHIELGDHYARVRMEANEATANVIRGAGSCRSFESGRRFKLDGHFRDDLNREYVLTQVQHFCHAGDFRSRDAESLDYRNNFVCIPHDVPLRPLPVTPRPIVRGPQTAIVMGPPNEDIWTDQYGRVKVRFHWDRHDKADEKRSCWVRVASFWAGKGWGALHLPRPGHEVVVDFLEGNPDRPLITGSVYNDANRPAWTLPEQENISGIRSRSTPEGTSETYNEIIMDDTKDKERIAIHAERNFQLRTEASETRSIGANSVTRVGGARSAYIRGEAEIKWEEVTDHGHDISRQFMVGDYLEVDGDRLVAVGKVMRTKAAEGHYTSVRWGDQMAVVNDGKQIMHVVKGYQLLYTSNGKQELIVTEGEQTMRVVTGTQAFEVERGDQKFRVKEGDYFLYANGDVSLSARARKGSGGYLNLEADEIVGVEAKYAIVFKVGETKLILTEEGVIIDAPIITQRALVKAVTEAPIVKVTATMQATVTGDVMTHVGSAGLVKINGAGVLIN
jgi:hypothetical protein